MIKSSKPSRRQILTLVPTTAGPRSTCAVPSAPPGVASGAGRDALTSAAWPGQSIEPVAGTATRADEERKTGRTWSTGVEYPATLETVSNEALSSDVRDALTSAA
ncbi:hypothetical protein FRC12_014653 [Ceratobasidium sp. 428]|nr:hypothetical protein FRC12_014653 [Ceratobasidium sp. 428]